MKIYFNTKAFDLLPGKQSLNITDDIRDAEMAVLGAKTIDFNKANKLKAIYRFGVGRDNIPEEIINRDNPKVYFPSEGTKRVLFESTANFACYLVLYMFYVNALGTVEPWNKYTRDFLGGKNLLIIGMGNIGVKVCEKMKTLMKVISFDIKQNNQNELKGLVEAADFISLHIPSCKETKDFINQEKLSWAKDDAVLINTARGAVVDEDALYDKIKNTNFRAAFDVFWKEPYEGKLKSLPNDKFFMTPHISSQTMEYVKAGFNDICSIISQEVDA